MEGFLMENSPMNVRKPSFGGTVNYSSGSLYGGFGSSNKSSARYSYSSQIHPPPPPINQLLLNTNYSSTRSLISGGSTLFSSSAPPPPPPPLYSSLPLHRPRHHQQPPLLPLPLKSASLPAPKAAKTKSQRRKTKKGQQPKPAETLSSIKPVEKAAKMAKEADQEEETEEEFLIGSPSSVLSPPPSSLPLPRLLLVKLRSSAKCAAGSCTAEAKAGALDAGATDDLRKLLRL